MAALLRIVNTWYLSSYLVYICTRFWMFPDVIQLNTTWFLNDGNSVQDGAIKFEKRMNIFNLSFGKNFKLKLIGKPTQK